MDPLSTIPEGTVPCPYIDYDKDSVGAPPTISAGLSQAQAARILQEPADQPQFRWNVSDKKRSNKEDGQCEAAQDMNNNTLFLHGIHKDTSGRLHSDTILLAFQEPYGCIDVRFPREKRSFCFLDFITHDDAARCLQLTGGEIVLAGIHLTIKWSNSGGGKPPIPPIGSIPPPPGTDAVPPPPPKRLKRDRLTEMEAADSTTLFLRMPPHTTSPDQHTTSMEAIRFLAQATLEDAINGDGNSKITAAEEPALKVTMRQLHETHNYGFLDFASHAAASMALATLTGTTNGGSLIGNDQVMGGVQLWWARPSKEKVVVHSETRTDCWFCLASPTCERHLLVSIFDTCYVAMPKGPAHDFHALIVPVSHDSRREEEEEMERVKQKLWNHTRTVLQMDLLVFERAIATKGGYHPHVQCIPIENASQVCQTLLEESKKCGFELNEVQELSRLPSDEGYFYAQVYSGTKGMTQFLSIGSKTTAAKVPLQFGRQVLASVTNRPELAHWKNSVLTREKEEELTQQYQASFQPFQ